MNEDIITIESELSLNEIGSRLRLAAEKLGAHAENAEPDPFGCTKPDMAIRFSGKNMFAGPREWCVIAYVTDKGYAREIQLNALGDKVGAKISSGFSMYRGERSSFYQLGDSVKRRDRIVQMLKG